MSRSPASIRQNCSFLLCQYVPFPKPVKQFLCAFHSLGPYQHVDNFCIFLQTFFVPAVSKHSLKTHFCSYSHLCTGCEHAVHKASRGFPRLPDGASISLGSHLQGGCFGILGVPLARWTPRIPWGASGSLGSHLQGGSLGVLGRQLAPTGNGWVGGVCTGLKRIPLFPSFI